MYLYLITRLELEELRHYQVLKNGRESHVYTMASKEKSCIIRGVYKTKKDAELDSAILRKNDKEYNAPNHEFMNFTTAGRKVYKDQSIKYSISGNQFQSYFASVKDNRIVSLSPTKEALETQEGAEIFEVVKIRGKFYKINDKPVYVKSEESAGENE